MRSLVLVALATTLACATFTEQQVKYVDKLIQQLVPEVCGVCELVDSEYQILQCDGADYDYQFYTGCDSASCDSGCDTPMELVENEWTVVVDEDSGSSYWASFNSSYTCSYQVVETTFSDSNCASTEGITYHAPHCYNTAENGVTAEYFCVFEADGVTWALYAASVTSADAEDVCPALADYTNKPTTETYPISCGSAQTTFECVSVSRTCALTYAAPLAAETVIKYIDESAEPIQTAFPCGYCNWEYEIYWKLECDEANAEAVYHHRCDDAACSSCESEWTVATGDSVEVTAPLTEDTYTATMKLVELYSCYYVVEKVEYEYAADGSVTDCTNTVGKKYIAPTCDYADETYYTHTDYYCTDDEANAVPKNGQKSSRKYTSLCPIGESYYSIVDLDTTCAGGADGIHAHSCVYSVSQLCARLSFDATSDGDSSDGSDSSASHLSSLVTLGAALVLLAGF